MAEVHFMGDTYASNRELARHLNMDDHAVRRGIASGSLGAYIARITIHNALARKGQRRKDGITEAIRMLEFAREEME